MLDAAVADAMIPTIIKHTGVRLAWRMLTQDSDARLHGLSLAAGDLLPRLTIDMPVTDRSLKHSTAHLLFGQLRHLALPPVGHRLIHDARCVQNTSHQALKNVGGQAVPEGVAGGPS